MSSAHRWVWLAALTCVLVAAVELLFSSRDQFLHIVACDVGQGDAILMYRGSTQLLIDGGNNAVKLQECLTRYVPYWDRRLEVVVATHPDADHIGGLSDVMNRFWIDSFYLTPITKKTADFEQFRRLVQRWMIKDSNVVMARAGEEFVLGDVIRIKVLSPFAGNGDTPPGERGSTEHTLWDTKSSAELSSTKVNDESIVLLLQYGEVRALMTGDIGSDQEQALLEAHVLQPVSILKVAHHGSKSSTTDSFLTAVSPEWAIVSAGVNNSYGHPSSEVLNRLEGVGAHIMRTDLEGTAHIITDGSRIWQADERH